MSLILVVSPIIKASAMTSNQDQRLVTLRDFKYFREFRLKDGTRIFLSKNKKIQTSSYTKDKVFIQSTTDGKKTLTEYTFTNKNIFYNVIFKSTDAKKVKIGYYPILKKQYFKIDPNYFCSPNDKLKSATNLKTLTSKINNTNIENLLDKNSCTNQEKNESLSDILRAAFTVEQSPFVKCLDSKKIQQIFENDQNLQKISNTFISKYTSLSEKIFASGNPIEIACTIPGANQNVLGSLDTSKTPTTLSLNITEIDKLYSNLIPDLVTHELLHSTDKPLVAQKDEKTINTLVCLCSEVNKSNISVETDISKNCEKTDSSSRDFSVGTANSLKNYSGLPVEITQRNNAITVTQNLEKEFEKTTSPVTYTPVDANTVIKLANTEIKNTNGVTVPKDGSPQEVSLSDDMASSIKSVSENFYKSATTTTKALGAALTQVSVANATTNKTTSAVATSTTTNAVTATYSPASTSSAASSTYSIPEIVADKYSKDFNAPDAESTRLAAAILPGSGTSSFAGTNYAATKAILQKSGSADSQISNASNSSGAITKSSPGNRSPASISSTPDEEGPNVATNTGDSEEQVAVAKTQSRSPASIDNAQTTIRVAPSDSTALQTLSALNKISGQQYISIKNKYNDPAFVKQLELRNTRIIYTNENGQKIVIGKTTKATEQFIDNGSALVKVP